MTNYGREPRWKDPKALQEAIDTYFKRCDDSAERRELKNGDVITRYGEVPTVIGLSVYLGISRPCFYEMLKGRYLEHLDNETKQNIQDTLNSARDRIEQLTLQGAMNGSYDSRISGMVLTAFGYNNKTDDDNTITVKFEGSTDWGK